MRTQRLPNRALVIRASARGYLFFGFLFAGFSNPGADRARGNSASGPVSSSCRSHSRSLATILVCANAALAREHIRSADRTLLDWHYCVAAPRLESVAARHARDLFRVFSLIHCCGTGFFELSIRWHVAGGGIYQPVFRSARLSSRPRCNSSASRQPVPPAVGVVPHLFSIRGGEATQQRCAVAELYCDGRVLPEPAAAYLDPLVPAAVVAPVSRSNRLRHTRDGARTGVDAFSATTVAHRLLLHRHSLADRGDSDCQLRFLELSCARDGRAAVR